MNKNATRLLSGIPPNLNPTMLQQSTQLCSLPCIANFQGTRLFWQELFNDGLVKSQSAITEQGIWGFPPQDTGSDFGGIGDVRGVADNEVVGGDVKGAHICTFKIDIFDSIALGIFPSQFNRPSINVNERYGAPYSPG